MVVIGLFVVGGLAPGAWHSASPLSQDQAQIVVGGCTVCCVDSKHFYFGQGDLPWREYSEKTAMWANTNSYTPGRVVDNYRSIAYWKWSDGSDVCNLQPPNPIRATGVWGTYSGPFATYDADCYVGPGPDSL